MFSAWSYSYTEVKMIQGMEDVQLDDYNSNHQWFVTPTSSREITTDEATVIFTLTLERKPSFYVIYIIVPIVLLTLLNCCTFLLPVASGERAGFSITVFLALSVLLTIVASEMPKNSDTTSILAAYLTSMTVLSTATVILCLVQIRLSTRRSPEDAINKPFLSLCKISHCLRCKTCKRSLNVKIRSSSTQTEDSNQVPIETAKEFTWMDVVSAMDCLLFWTCTLFVFFTTLIFFTVTSLT